jgi:hypothetical protein
MASGHVNRIYRPNTWQHRPSLRREDFSCQPGAVHTWHLADIGTATVDVRCWSAGVERTWPVVGRCRLLNPKRTLSRSVGSDCMPFLSRASGAR